MDPYAFEDQDIASQLASMSLQEGNDLIPDEEMAEAAQTGHFGLFSRAFLLPGKNTVVKQGTGDLLIEAQTMCYVRRNTSIPVPKVYELRGSDNDAQLFMEHISGSRLSDVWPALSADDQAAVVAQLRGYLAELAAMTSRFAGAIDVSPVRDSFFAYAPNSVCTSEQEFNTTLLKAWYLNTAEWSEDEPQFPTLWQLLNDTMRGNRFVMTYNNLDPRNILVRGSQVVALLDWSQAGFLPEYWEYCRPLTRSWEVCNGAESFFIQDEVLDQILTPRREEFRVFQFRFSQLQTKVYFNIDKQWRQWNSEKGIYTW